MCISYYNTHTTFNTLNTIEESSMTNNTNAFVAALRSEPSSTIGGNGMPQYDQIGGQFKNIMKLIQIAKDGIKSIDKTELKGIIIQGYLENPFILSMALLYIRAITREDQQTKLSISGMGRRDIFIFSLNTLYENDYKDIVIFLSSRIPLVGYIKDATGKSKGHEPLNYKIIRDYVMPIIIEGLKDDNYKYLIAKYLPTEGDKYFKIFLNAFIYESIIPAVKDQSYQNKIYRKYVSGLRKEAFLVEHYIHSNNYSEIDYKKVPSRAMLQYQKLFKKKDFERYSNFIEKAISGETTINSSTLYIHEIYHNLEQNKKNKISIEWKQFEAMWNNYPQFFNINGNLLTVIDGSASMKVQIDNGKPYTYLDVARGLGLYVATKLNTGAFKDIAIEFSRNSNIIDLKNKSLNDQVKELYNKSKIENTDIEKVFNQILKIANDNNVSQEDMPKAILIISDMQFDRSGYNITAHELIKKKYFESGYEVPLIVYWNLDAKSSPVKYNSVGAALLNGYSVGTLKAIADLDFKRLDVNSVTPEKIILSNILQPAFAYGDEEILTIINHHRSVFSLDQ